MTLWLGLIMLAGILCAGGSTRYQVKMDLMTLPDVRTALPLDDRAASQMRGVMLQHLESIELIVAALAARDFERARGLTEQHLGFFMHRQAMASQHPEDFPPAYHDLAHAHHEAAEQLADSMPSGDFTIILPKFDAVLKACIACHQTFRMAHSRPE
jgi:hypothetical protein